MNSKILAHRLVRLSSVKTAQQRLIGQAVKSSLFSKLIQRLSGVAGKAKAGGKRYVELLRGGNNDIVGGYRKTLSDIRKLQNEALMNRNTKDLNKLSDLYAEVVIGARTPYSNGMVSRIPGADLQKRIDLANELLKSDMTRAGTAVGGIAGVSALAGGGRSDSLPKSASVKKAGAGKGVVNILKGLAQIGAGTGQTGVALADILARGVHRAGKGAARYGSLLTGFKGNMLDREWKALSRANKPFSEIKPVADASRREWQKVWATRLATLAGLGAAGSAMADESGLD